MSVYAALGLVLLGYMVLWFIVSLIKQRNDVADIAWGLGFPLLSWITFFLSGFSLLSVLVNILVTIWGGRLAVHIYLRNRNRLEDSRYLVWREQWRYFYLRSFLQVFMLQGALLFLIAMPVIFINRAAVGDFQYVQAIGIVVWLVGFYFEVVGDRQLTVFVKNPLNKGKIMQQGLWKYTRHPNYFGEVAMWWGIFIVALSTPGGFVSIVGPVTITILILFVSGIPMLERRYAQNAEFQAYKKKTSAFFPLPPRA